MQKLINTSQEEITSLELVKQINLFRSQEGNRTELGHNGLLKIIRDEFEEEIRVGKISHTPYIHPQNGQSYPMFTLTISQAKQVLVRESKFVRKAIINYLEKLEQELKSKTPKTFKEALLMLVDEIEEKEKLIIVTNQQQQIIEAQKPKVLFADAVSASKTTILVGELAKILKQNGIDIGQNRFFEWLRYNGYLISRQGTDYNMPTQKGMNLNLFTIKETSITHSDGHISVSKTTKVTGSGQTYFINKFLKNQQSA